MFGYFAAISWQSRLNPGMHVASGLFPTDSARCRAAAVAVEQLNLRSNDDKKDGSTDTQQYR
jgi:hypothetical protein